MTYGAWTISPADLVLIRDRGADVWPLFRNKSLFVTGATGFVGKWLIASLLHASRTYDLNVRVTALTRDCDSFARRHPELALAPELKLIAGDIRRFDAPNGPVDLVVHGATDIAAPDQPLATFDVCVGGTRRVLDYAVSAGAERVLLLSSGAIYGRQPAGMSAMDEHYSGAPDVLDLRAAYGSGKRAAEWLTVAYGERHGFAARIARGFAFVGPYLPMDKHFAIGNFIDATVRGTDIVISGDGTPYRSYLYAADLAIWCWAILMKGSGAGVYNVGGADALTISELAARVVAVLGGTNAVRIMTEPSGRVADRYVPSVERARADLGLTAWTSLDVGIERTAEWHRASLELN